MTLRHHDRVRDHLVLAVEWLVSVGATLSRPDRSSFRCEVPRPDGTRLTAWGPTAVDALVAAYLTCRPAPPAPVGFGPDQDGGQP